MFLGPVRLSARCAACQCVVRDNCTPLHSCRVGPRPRAYGVRAAGVRAWGEPIRVRPECVGGANGVPYVRLRVTCWPRCARVSVQPAGRWGLQVGSRWVCIRACMCACRRPRQMRFPCMFVQYKRTNNTLNALIHPPTQTLCVPVRYHLCLRAAW